MLDLSKMAAGRLVLDISSANLTQIVKDETSRMQGKADQREIILTVTAKKVPNFDFDRNKVLEVVTNFISNAIQYSPDNSVITVQLASTKDAVEFTVADQGIGVPKQSQKKLFTKFYRSKNAKQARPSGTGVGLYFAKQVISAHNGEVFYKPNPKGGSIFGFKIPLKRTAKKKKV
jgi:signal transduction histidine kinase